MSVIQRLFESAYANQANDISWDEHLSTVIQEAGYRLVARNPGSIETLSLLAVVGQARLRMESALGDTLENIKCRDAFPNFLEAKIFELNLVLVKVPALDSEHVDPAVSGEKVGVAIDFGQRPGFQFIKSVGGGGFAGWGSGGASFVSSSSGAQTRSKEDAFWDWIDNDDFSEAEGFPTLQAEKICMEILPAVLRRFLEKNADYGENASTLGLKGQFADIHRKYGKLKRAWWDGENLKTEPADEVAEDMIAHLLLALLFIFEEGE